MTDIRLYFIVRTDMDSMTPGRVAAQVSHATSHAKQTIENATPHNPSREMLKKWEAETSQAFGTAIVLDGNKIESIVETVEALQDLGIAAGLVLDPTYSIADGDVTHYVPAFTVGWALVDVKNSPTPAITILKGFELYTGEHSY